VNAITGPRACRLLLRQRRTYGVRELKIGTDDWGPMNFSPNARIATLSSNIPLRATFRPTECPIGHA
jgi:hypothetical protein